MLTATETLLFDQANQCLADYGTGDFRKDLPKALKLVAANYDQAGGLTPLQGLVIGAAARRLDEIAKNVSLSAFPDEPIAQIASDLREFRHKEGA